MNCPECFSPAVLEYLAVDTGHHLKNCADCGYTWTAHIDQQATCLLDSYQYTAHGPEQGTRPMSRHVRSDIAFSPVNCARRMRDGLWVTAQYREVRPSELDDTHLESLRVWLLENAAFYAACLLIHPDRPAPERRNGHWVRRTSTSIARLNHFEKPPFQGAQSIVKATKLYQDILREIQRREREERRTFYVTDPASNEDQAWLTSPAVNTAGVHIGDPQSTGTTLVLTLDNGETVTIGVGKIEVQSGSRTVAIERHL